MKAIVFLISIFISLVLNAFPAGNEVEYDFDAAMEGSNNIYSYFDDGNFDSQKLSKEDHTESIYGEDSAKCVRNLSIYVEYYRQGNYANAVDSWRWVYKNCPAARQNTYIHGANIFKYLYSQEKDPVKREMYIDSLMMLYDKRIKYFNREGSVLGRKAADLYTFRPNNVQEIYEISEKSITLEGDDASPDVLLINFHSLSNLVEAGLKEVDEIVLAYDRAISIIDNNIAADPDGSKPYKVTKNNIDAMFSPYASCENITSIFRPRFDNNPENVELLEKIVDMLDKSGCTEEKLYYEASLNLHRISPSAESAYSMGRMEQNMGNYKNAVKFFEQSLELYENEEDKFTSYMFLVDILFKQFNNYTEAREYALKAAEVRPGNGRPFLLIGEMYAASAKQCGDNEFTEKVAYWAAVDKALYAKSIDDDPLVEQRADALVDIWTQHYPTLENIFFYGFEEGDTYTVKCWINEKTRIRARN